VHVNLRWLACDYTHIFYEHIRRRPQIRIVTIIMMLVLTGCESLTFPAREHKLANNTIYWFDYSASRRGAILVPNQETMKIVTCSEPAPDVAKDIVDTFKGNVSSGKVSVGGEADIQEKVIQLAQRTQTIMFLRESLFRLCELSINLRFEKADVIPIYMGVIQSAQTMAEAESFNAQAANAKAQEELIKTRLLVIAVPELLQARREKAAAFVKTLNNAQLNALAKSLGKPGGENALIDILTTIAGANSADTFNTIAQKIKVLFNKEV